MSVQDSAINADLVDSNKSLTTAIFPYKLPKIWPLFSVIHKNNYPERGWYLHCQSLSFTLFCHVNHWISIWKNQVRHSNKPSLSLLIHDIRKTPLKFWFLFFRCIPSSPSLWLQRKTPREHKGVQKKISRWLSPILRTRTDSPPTTAKPQYPCL